MIHRRLHRRELLIATAALPALAWAQATPEQLSALQNAITRFTGGAALQSGKVQIEIAPLVDNGNTVPVSVRADHPMRADDHVAAIAIFSERNPSADVFEATLSPAWGKAEVSTRMRLVTTQTLTAVAKLSNGQCFAQRVNVIVTLAACLEPDETSA
jgi:sulfur-oxidizing protein SoxY